MGRNTQLSNCFRNWHYLNAAAPVTPKLRENLVVLAFDQSSIDGRRLLKSCNIGVGRDFVSDTPKQRSSFPNSIEKGMLQWRYSLKGFTCEHFDRFSLQHDKFQKKKGNGGLLNEVTFSNQRIQQRSPTGYINFIHRKAKVLYWSTITKKMKKGRKRRSPMMFWMTSLVD